MTNARTAKTTREKAAELRAEAQRKEARRRNLIVSGAVIAVIVVVVGAIVLVRAAKNSSDAATAAASAPPAHLTDGGILVGNPNAKVTIKLYEDFQCPACQQFEQANAAQLKAWADQGVAKLLYHPVAILDEKSSTNYSTRSLNAAAALVAADPAAFPAFHSLLYANQPAEGAAGLPDSQLIDYAVQAGAQKAAVEAAITSQKYQGWAAKVTDDFSKAGYNATPTIVVGGKQLSDVSPTALKAAVEAAAK